VLWGGDHTAVIRRPPELFASLDSLHGFHLLQGAIVPLNPAGIAGMQTLFVAQIQFAQFGRNRDDPTELSLENLGILMLLFRN